MIYYSAFPPSISKKLILLRPSLKNTYIIQLFHLLFQKQRFEYYFNLYNLAEEIMTAITLLKL